MSGALSAIISGPIEGRNPEFNASEYISGFQVHGLTPAPRNDGA